MNIEIPELALVALMGPSGSGKSTFARKHFLPTEILSSDRCRGLVSDDDNDQGASADAFDVLHFIAGKRLKRGHLTVVDATHVDRDARKPIVALAREHDVLPVAIVLNMPESVCHERNRTRGDRDFGPHVVRRQAQRLRKSLRGLKREGFRNIVVLDSPGHMDEVTVRRVPLWNDHRHDHGPFDLVGDIHGCFDETVALLKKLGYRVNSDPSDPSAEHPDGRRAIFLGDLVDRGPNSPGVLRLVMKMCASGNALCVPGNHDVKLKKKLDGRNVRLTHGLAQTMSQLEGEPEDFLKKVREFIHGLVSHLVLDEGKLVVAHAGMKESFQGRASGRVREFALYGETDGEIDAFGLPVRYDWAADYRGTAKVVYGHTPMPQAQWHNRTLCLDTGCVFGGELTALRYPENELVSVSAAKVYFEPVPTPREGQPAETLKRPADLLDIADVQGKRVVTTRVRGRIGVREENAAAALEVMSRFAVDPRWLIYLPPTMSPSETCSEGPYLEHPSQSFQYYRNHGVPAVICQEKHMGSRAVVVICKDETTAANRFGIAGDGFGSVFTRTGRPFFSDPDLAEAFLGRLHSALSAVDFWSRFESDWFCLDAELLPWSAKAQALLRGQYAPVGSSSRASLASAVDALSRAKDQNEGIADLLLRYQERQDCAEQYTDAYRRYCWPVSGMDGLRFAPFHLLASEGRTYFDRDHRWHMETLATLCDGDPDFLKQTAYRIVDLVKAESESAAIDWWLGMTETGGEGMVVKPLDWLVRGSRGLVQPALKCRGREYLRIIYGPEYTLPEHLQRLRTRGLGTKRSLALREFSLGVEALERFVEKEPLYRVHECVFGTLALESEPVDPRL